MDPTAIVTSQSCQTLTDWLCYIEQSHPIDQIKLGLAPVLQVAKRADLQHLPGIKILIGGTNGKGTTARCLEQLLLAEGYTVGVYSSPHLLKFNERLRVQGLDVADALWVEAFHQVENLRQDVALTYFEFTTLAAFAVLKTLQVQISIIEVGLGGRLDATNIIEPDLSIITTIDLDHQDWLGNDRDSIAFEKAGIFRSKGKVVIGELDPPATLLSQVCLLDCDSRFANQQFQFQLRAQSWDWQGQSAQFNNLPMPALPVQNVATALAALEVLQLLPALDRVARVLQQLTLPGRMEWLQRTPGVLLDVAHNPQSTRYLSSQLRLQLPHYRRVIALVGMLKDKDIQQSLAPLTEVITEWHCVDLGGARGAPASLLQQSLPANCQFFGYTGLEQAWQNLAISLQPDDLLVVFGSFVTVSGFMTLWTQGNL